MVQPVKPLVVFGTTGKTVIALFPRPPGGARKGSANCSRPRLLEPSARANGDTFVLLLVPVPHSNARLSQHLFFQTSSYVLLLLFLIDPVLTRSWFGTYSVYSRTFCSRCSTSALVPRFRFPFLPPNNRGHSEAGERRKQPSKPSSAPHTWTRKLK